MCCARVSLSPLGTPQGADVILPEEPCSLPICLARSKKHKPRTGKAFSVFLAEISLSTPLPVLLLQSDLLLRKCQTPGTPALIWRGHGQGGCFPSA